MENNKTETSEIVICEKCEGEGAVYERTYVDGGENVKCYVCNGHGRLIRTETIEFKPLEK